MYSIVQRQWTPLHHAVINGHSGTAQVLVEAKADVDAVGQVCMWGEGVGGWVRGGVGYVMNKCVYMCAYRCI